MSFGSKYARYEDEENNYSEIKYYFDEFNRLIKQETTSFDSKQSFHLSFLWYDFQYVGTTFVIPIIFA